MRNTVLAAHLAGARIPRLELVMDYPTLEKYQQLSKGVAGFLQKSQAAFWDVLFALQARFGVSGDMLEIGVDRGRSALMALTHLDTPKEHCILVDLNIGDKLSETAQNIPDEWKENVTILAGDSRRVIQPEAWIQERRIFRWVHIDGGHTYEVVKADLINSELLLHDKGLICCDDFFNERYPQIASAVFEFCQRHPERLSFLAVGDNKCYLVRPACHERYYQALLTETADEMTRRNVETTIFEGEAAGAKCLGIRPIRN